MAINQDTIRQGDCITGLKKLPAGTVDLAFADPPFNIGYDYDEYDDRQEHQAYLSWTRKWMGGVSRVLKPDGTFWVAIGDEYAAEVKLIGQNDLGLTCRSWVIWYYTFGVNCKHKFSRSHAHLFYFVKDPDNFTFNDQDPAVRVPSARQLVYADRRANPKGRLPDDTWILRPQDLPDGFKPDEDTWYFPRVAGTFKERAGFHGCQMPEQLLARIIRSCSNEGDMVLDPFGGSGTTLAVAKKLGRAWLGFELSKDYAKQARQRLRKIKQGDPVDGAAKPLTSAPSTPATTRRILSTMESQDGEAREQTSPLIQRLNFSLGQVAVATGEISTAIAEAYLAACEGFSIDRMIADPKLNSAYLRACRDLAIPGRPVEWNQHLLGLRKAGKLNALPSPRQTKMRRAEMDGFLFASEIAWQILADEKGLSLDEILCNPARAKEFDRIAGRFAPGWTPFHYRWGALKVRKEAKTKKNHARALPPKIRATHFDRRAVSPDDLNAVPKSEGVYLIRVEGVHLYLGETFDLHDRVRAQAEHLSELLPGPELSKLPVRNVRFNILSLPNAPLKHRLGKQSQLLGELDARPLLNAAFNQQAFVA